jgi:hypothetical protein
MGAKHELAHPGRVSLKGVGVQCGPFLGLQSQQAASLNCVGYAERRRFAVALSQPSWASLQASMTWLLPSSDLRAQPTHTIEVGLRKALPWYIASADMLASFLENSF